MISAREILGRLNAIANARDAIFAQRFFKTGPGEYGEGDVFLGIRVPAVRKLAREFRDVVSAEEILRLLKSKFHEARLLALLLLVEKFERGDEAAKRAVYVSYLSGVSGINNWDLVDVSAARIVGAWLHGRDRAPLYKLARSKNLWERRIAIIATLYFIRQDDFGDTLRLAEFFLRDGHDLMHKACGWMLREAGKRDVRTLEAFLERHAAEMPRTMLRYAIEKFPEARRRAYLRAGRP